jgi:hypothetical protein
MSWPCLLEWILHDVVARHSPRQMATQKSPGYLSLEASKPLHLMLIINSGLTESHEYGPGASQDSCPASDLHTRRAWSFVTVAINLTFPLLAVAKHLTVSRMSIAR